MPLALSAALPHSPGEVRGACGALGTPLGLGQPGGQLCPSHPHTCKQARPHTRARAPGLPWMQAGTHRYLLHQHHHYLPSLSLSTSREPCISSRQVLHHHQKATLQHLGHMQPSNSSMEHQHAAEQCSAHTVLSCQDLPTAYQWGKGTTQTLQGQKRCSQWSQSTQPGTCMHPSPLSPQHQLTHNQVCLQHSTSPIRDSSSMNRRADSLHMDMNREASRLNRHRVTMGSAAPSPRQMAQQMKTAKDLGLRRVAGQHCEVCAPTQHWSSPSGAGQQGAARLQVQLKQGLRAVTMPVPMHMRVSRPRRL
jgi:hypothetical protein